MDPRKPARPWRLSSPCHGLPRHTFELLLRGGFVLRTGARFFCRRSIRAPKTMPRAEVEGILHEAERFRADLIAVGWRGHGAARRLLMGNVSRGVVQAALQAPTVLPPVAFGRRSPVKSNASCQSRDEGAEPRRRGTR